MKRDKLIDFEPTQPAELDVRVPSATESPTFFEDALFVVRLRAQLHELRKIDRAGTLFAREREAIESALFELRDVHWTRNAFISFVYGVEGTSRAVWLLLAVALAIATTKAGGALSS